MPPFLLISASAYLAPSTSLCARADSTPVSGLTMPILTGSSPSARTIYGAAKTWLAPSATPALRIVRRPIGVRICDIRRTSLVAISLCGDGPVDLLACDAPSLDAPAQRRRRPTRAESLRLQA